MSVTDLVLVYGGGKHRNVSWNKDHFVPYVSYKNLSNKEQWLFDGLGTMLIGLIIGGAGGSTIGYRIGLKKNIRQKQKAGNNATQTQVGGSYNAR